MGKYELALQLEDGRAIEIVKGLPESERDQIIEKYIIVGDTVVKYASIVTSEASLQRFFEPVTKDLRKLSEDLDKARKNLEENIPGTLKDKLGEIAQRLGGTADSFKTQQENYAKMLSDIFPTLAKTKRGAISCDMIFDELRDTFREDEFEDVSSKARFTDVIGMPPFATQPILIENKDWTEPVASSEVEKFWRDMETRNATIGCFFSLRSSIRTITSDLSIIPKGSSVGIFVVNEAFSHRGHIFGYMVARKMLEMLNQRPVVEAGKYELLVKILNNRLQELKCKLDDFESIENEIWRAKDDLAKTLERIAKGISKLRNTIETIIENTFKDFSVDIE
jgi:hypothetical protein